MFIVATSKVWCVFAALCALAGLAGMPPDAKGQDMRARFESEAPRGWAKIVEMSRRCDVEQLLKQIRPDRDEQTLFTAKFAGTNLAYTVKYMKSGENAGRRSGEENVICCNSKYGFELKRSAKDRPWNVNYLGNDVSDIFSKGVDEGACIAPQFSLSIGMLFLPDWSKQESFKVVNVEAIEGVKGERAAVRFENARPTKELVFWIQRGTLILNPERLWAIEQYDVDVVFQPTGEARWWSLKTEFAPGPDNFPVVRESLQRQGPKGGAEDFRNSWVFNRFELRDVPESEFTLSAFGLPEINARPASRWRWWAISLAAAGVLLIAAGFLVRRRARAN